MRIRNSRISQEEILSRFEKVHGKTYNYNETIFKNIKLPVKIWCNIHHNFFEQTPDNHIRGSGCPKCGLIKRIKNKTKTLESFIESASKIHNNNYSYNNFKYINAITKGFITCPKHGDFSCSPNNHISKKIKCSKCSNRYKINKN